MHFHRLTALAGVVVGIIGLFFSSLTTDGEAALPALSQQSDSFPDGIPTIWGGLDAWAQVVLVVLIVATVAIALMPERSLPFDKTMAPIVSVIGVAVLAYAIVKALDASDSADNLEAGFAQAAGVGVPGVAAWPVEIGIGFFVLIVGAAVVAVGGLLSMLANSAE